MAILVALLAVDYRKVFIVSKGKKTTSTKIAANPPEVPVIRHLCLRDKFSIINILLLERFKNLDWRF